MWREKINNITSRLPYRELNASLLGWCEGEDVRVRTLIYAFKNGQIGDNTTGVEIFESLVLLGGYCARAFNSR